MISKDIIEKVQNETDIVALVSEFVTLERTGKNYRGLCPFHDDSNPSFSVSPEKNIAMCMTCHGGGRPIKFYREIKNIGYNQAVSELADKLGIKVTLQDSEDTTNSELYELMEDAKLFYKAYLFNSASGEPVLNYLKGRKLTNETIDHFDLGYAPNSKDDLYNYLSSKKYKVSDMIDLGLVKRADDGSYYDFFRNRLVFPITNESGNTVAFSARGINPNDNPKYINSPDTPIFKKSLILYNLSESRLEIRKQKEVIIFEGFFDVISAYQADIKNAIASMGTSFTTEQAKLIKDVSPKAIIAFDGDNAGINATLSLLPSLHRENVVTEVLKLPEKLDPDDYIKKHGKDEFTKLVKSSRDSYDFEFNYYLKQANLENINDIEKLISNVEKMLGYARPTVAAIYRNKLATILNIDEKLIKVKSKEVPEIVINQKPYETRLDTKYEKAEKALFCLMTKSFKFHEDVNDLIGFTDTSNIILSSLRRKLKTEYRNVDGFDLVSFESMLNDNEFDYFKNQIQTNIYWTDINEIDEEQFNIYIELVKETTLLRRREYLRSLISEKVANKQKFDLEIKEFNDIVKKLKDLKED